MKKLFLDFLKKKKSIQNMDDLLSSLESSPYDHVLPFSGIVIHPGALRISQRAGLDFNLYINAKKQSGWLMSIEGVSVHNGVMTIRHLSVHKEFRGLGLGKPCVECFLSLIKKECGIKKTVFRERLGRRPHYAAFFSDTLGARLCDDSPAWELSV